MGTVARAYAMTWIDKPYIVVITQDFDCGPFSDEDGYNEDAACFRFAITDLVLGTVLYEHPEAIYGRIEQIEQGFSEPICDAISKLYRKHIVGQ
jgi:hypothetical protein